jgi:predicted naringenin-chalcone synthase
MSSPTVLFVLDRVMRRARPGERVVATAFGPGVTVESALMTVEGPLDFRYSSYEGGDL